jgi:hypothetical protein
LVKSLDYRLKSLFWDQPSIKRETSYLAQTYTPGKAVRPSLVVYGISKLILRQEVPLARVRTLLKRIAWLSDSILSGTTGQQILPD